MTTTATGPAIAWPVLDGIGTMGQFSAVDDSLTGEENLLLMAGLHHLGRARGRRRVADLLDRFGLDPAARKPAAAYSGGMRRRLDLAMGLIGEHRQRPHRGPAGRVQHIDPGRGGIRRRRYAGPARMARSAATGSGTSPSCPDAGGIAASGDRALS